MWALAGVFVGLIAFGWAAAAGVPTLRRIPPRWLFAIFVVFLTASRSSDAADALAWVLAILIVGIIPLYALIGFVEGWRSGGRRVDPDGSGQARYSDRR